MQKKVYQILCKNGLVETYTHMDCAVEDDGSLVNVVIGARVGE